MAQPLGLNNMPPPIPPPPGFRMMTVGEVSTTDDMCIRDGLSRWERVRLAYDVAVGNDGSGTWNERKWWFCRMGKPIPKEEKIWLNPWD